MGMTAVYFLFTWPEHRDAFRVGRLSVLGEGREGILDAFQEHGWRSTGESWVGGRDMEEATGLGMTALGGILECGDDWNGANCASMEYRVPHYGFCVTGTDDGHVTFAGDGKRFSGYTGYSSNCIAPLTFVRQNSFRGFRWRPWGIDDHMDETASIIKEVKSRIKPERTTIMGAMSLQVGLPSNAFWSRPWPQRDVVGEIVRMTQESVLSRLTSRFGLRTP